MSPVRIQIAQQPHRQVPVHRLAIPAGDTGLRVDETVFELLLKIDDDVVAEDGSITSFWNDFTELVLEDDLAMIVRFTGKTALVH